LAALFSKIILIMNIFSRDKIERLKRKIEKEKDRVDKKK